MGGEDNNSERHKKYLSIAAYAFLVIVASFAACLLVMNFFSIWSAESFTQIFKVLTPLINGFVIAYLINPLCDFLEKTVLKKLKEKSKKVLSLISAYIIAIAAIILLMLMVIPQVGQSVRQLAGMVSDLFSPYVAEEAGSAVASDNNPDDDLSELADLNIDKSTLANTKIGVYMTDFAASIQDYIDSLGLDLNIEKTFNDFLVGLAENIADIFTRFISPAISGAAVFVIDTASVVWNIILGLLLSIYLLFNKVRLIAQTKKLVFAILPSGFAYKITKVMRKTHEILGGFITGKILDSLIVGVICFFSMSVFGIRYAVLISFIVAITNVIPFFGPFIGAIPSIFFLAIVDVWQAVWFAVFILILQQVDGNVIGPAVVGKKIGLTGFWVVTAVIVMSGFFGLAGVFIGVPVFALAYALVKEYAESRLERKGFPTKTDDYVRSDEGDAIIEKKSRGSWKDSFVKITKVIETVTKIGKDNPKDKADKDENRKDDE
ncbi:AI-2E family transporter [Clostridia bacterium]|nr:AI-2E family transporter [Clostridia bacterium]GHV11143.1 AI-2E family transporter [Clostridia bacterium]